MHMPNYHPEVTVLLNIENVDQKSNTELRNLFILLVPVYLVTFSSPT